MFLLLYYMRGTVSVFVLAEFGERGGLRGAAAENCRARKGEGRLEGGNPYQEPHHQRTSGRLQRGGLKN